jgi:hypothetical protein
VFAACVRGPISSDPRKKKKKHKPADVHDRTIAPEDPATLEDRKFLPNVKVENVIRIATI